MLTLNCGLHPIPQLGLKTDQITEQPNEIDCHGRSLQQIDSMELT